MFQKEMGSEGINLSRALIEEGQLTVDRYESSDDGMKDCVWEGR